MYIRSIISKNLHGLYQCKTTCQNSEQFKYKDQPGKIQGVIVSLSQIQHH